MKKKWSSQAQINRKKNVWNPYFQKMMKKKQFIKEGHLQKVFVASHRVMRSPPNDTPTHIASYRADPRQRVLKKTEVSQIVNFELTESTTTKWAF